MTYPFASPGQGFPQDITAGGALIIPQIYSPNFSTATSSGWGILADGSAYFYDVTVSGTITGSVFKGTDFVIDSSGAFFYDGPATAGSLIVAIAATAGTDPFSNSFSAGVGTYNSGENVILEDGIIRFQSGTVSCDIAFSVGGGGLEFTNLLNQLPATFEMPIQATQGSATNPTLITTDTWHNLPLGASWSGTLQYSLKPDNTVMLRSQGTLTVGTRTTGTAIATLPTGYLPSFQMDMPIVITANSSGAAAVNSPFITLATAGTITVANVSTQVATNVAVLGSYPLD